MTVEACYLLPLPVDAFLLWFFPVASASLGPLEDSSVPVSPFRLQYAAARAADSATVRTISRFWN